jgi:methylated-DNA-[protein]-cysteine S-methyltransferase
MTGKTTRSDDADQGSHFFATAIGTCALVWGPAGIRSVHLPEASDRETRERVAGEHPSVRETEPPDRIRQVAASVARLVEGGSEDLAGVALDWNGVTPFQRRVYEAAREIPPGETRSYGELARRVGVPGGARAVGHALGRNPFVLVVPCHRVLAANGGLGGFSAHGGVRTKRMLLDIEAGTGVR